MSPEDTLLIWVQRLQFLSLFLSLSHSFLICFVCATGLHYKPLECPTPQRESWVFHFHRWLTLKTFWNSSAHEWTWFPLSTAICFRPQVVPPGEAAWSAETPSKPSRAACVCWRWMTNLSTWSKCSKDCWETTATCRLTCVASLTGESPSHLFSPFLMWFGMEVEHFTL